MAAKKINKKILEQHDAVESTTDKGKQDHSKFKKPKPLGSAKAVDTMFRNAILAELDIIALAATKANIMISLNGFIISALMISGAFIFSSSPGFLLPAGVFLFTAAASIVFALLAASPEQVGLFGNLWDWVKAVCRREARLRDIRTYIMHGRRSSERGELNLLIYEDRVRLSRKEYWDRMQKLLRDQDDVYHKMSDHLYWLGLMANRKFKLLNISYTLFRLGLLASVIVFVSIKSVYNLFPDWFNEDIVRLQNLGISEFTDIYEPSAVQQLVDGRVLVVEDEASRAISVMTIGHDGSLVENPTLDLKLIRRFGRKLSDLEGLSIDDNDFIYATTSHSMNTQGKRSADREQLLRFRIKGNDVGDISAYTELRKVLMAATDLKIAIKARTGHDIDFNQLNIEGLAYYKEAQHLLLGLREPKGSDFSIILMIENPADVFEQQVSPRFGEPILLNLKGGGIRALSYDPVLQTFLIVNEIENTIGDRYSQLWTWNGELDATPIPIKLPGIINLNNVESIDSIMIFGEPRLLIVSDEGNAKQGRPAKYMMLDYKQLLP